MAATNRYETELVGHFAGPTVAELISRALALLVETRAEEFDRTLPGGMFRGEWMPMPHVAHLSRRTAATLRLRERNALAALGLEPTKLSHRETHQRMLAELDHMRSSTWWADLEQAWIGAYLRPR